MILAGGLATATTPESVEGTSDSRWSVPGVKIPAFRLDSDHAREIERRWGRKVPKRELRAFVDGAVAKLAIYQVGPTYAAAVRDGGRLLSLDFYGVRTEFDDPVESREGWLYFTGVLDFPVDASQPTEIVLEGGGKTVSLECVPLESRAPAVEPLPENFPREVTVLVVGPLTGLTCLQMQVETRRR